MRTFAVQVGAKYQIVIPKAVREALGLGPQGTLLFLVDGDTVMLRARPASFTQALLGMHQHLWRDPDTWLEQERASWE